MKKSKKAQEGLVLSKKTTLTNLISGMNFATVPLTQLLSKKKIGQIEFLSRGSTALDDSLSSECHLELNGIRST